MPAAMQTCPWGHAGTVPIVLRPVGLLYGHRDQGATGIALHPIDAGQIAGLYAAVECNMTLPKRAGPSSTDVSGTVGGVL